MQPNTSKRLFRIDRDDDTHVVEDENAHLWAISYADFLMALLSFFVLYFSLDGPERESTFIKMISQISDATDSGAARAQIQHNESRLPASVIESLSKLDVQLQKDKDSFLIDFPNDLFKPGQHHFRREKIDLIKNFLTLVKPYENDINIYFEGHTDDTPLHRHKNEIIIDNFVLSSLRASTALGIARDVGFSEKYLFTQAASSNLRNSRSLSIRLEPRQVPQVENK